MLDSILTSFPKRINFWQLLENKSAFSEGVIATEVLFLNQIINLKISHHFFFATQSPLANFVSGQYLPPIKTELDYIEQRVNLISKCRQLMANYHQDSKEFGYLKMTLWLLKFQLYGFGQKLIIRGQILYGLIALREAGILEKDHIKKRIVEILKENSKFAPIIAEFF